MPKPPREKTGRHAAESAGKELARAIREADPAAFLVPARIVRRVIREQVDLPGLAITLPHRKTFVIRRDELFRIVDRFELGLTKHAYPPDPVLLIAEPSEEALLHLAPGELRRRAWRLLFHARIHAVFLSAIGGGRLPASAIRARIDRIGQTAFDEIRAVLRQEELLLPPRTDRAVYTEFAAFFLDTFHFAPNLLPHYFPGIRNPERIRAVLAEDVDEEALLEETRIAGAPAPDAVDLGHEERRWEESRAAAEAEKPRRPSARRYRRLARRAERARAAGNLVRAAILILRAGRRSPTGDGSAERAEADARLDEFLSRLESTLRIPAADLSAWRDGLSALLERTGQKLWSREARTLYDLQKVCVDRERGVFTIDPVEWLLSLGRRPIRRWLPSEREALENRHLRSAHRRLPGLRLPPETHARFLPVLRRAVTATEQRLRETFRPRLPAVFREVGLTPGNLPERMALDTLTEEILDRIVDRGRLTMGDLRDAISRNQLKLPDVRNPVTVLRRDPLLRADRKLAVSLDGVYRRAEFYLRWLQRLSALALGTAVGRLLVKYAVIPFGGAFVVLEGLQHIVNPALTWLGGEELHLATPLRALILGAFLLGLVHSRSFRRQIWEGLRWVFRGLRTVLYTIPTWVVRLPLFQRLLESRPFLLAVRYLVKPAVYSALLFGALRLFGSKSPENWKDAVLVFLAVDFLVNIPAGRRLEEITYDRMARNFHRFRVRVLSGLYQLVVGFFRDLLDALDRFLYSVDEWFRFRSGESRLSLVVKPVIGVVWFFVSYIVRIYTTLLIEPQVNPIKHFPVVTVSHKLTLPFAKPLTELLATPLVPVFGAVVGYAIAGTTVLLLPGVSGFLVWELKENWKLFAANRPKSLRPVRVGHHGESMLRLMKPGIHSGTLPKLYARLRRAERKAWRPGSERRIRKLVNDLHHVQEAMIHFAERDLLPLLGAAAPGPYSVAEVRMGSNAIRMRITRDGGDPLILSFEEQSGWLVASVSSSGWLADLTGAERVRARNAIAGIYKWAGAEIVREQIQAALGDGQPPAWDISDEGLVVWPGESFETEIVYPLTGTDRLVPRVTTGTPPTGLGPLAPGAVLYSERDLPWAEWVAAWDADEGSPPVLIEGARLL